MSIEYKIWNLHEQERFKISINGDDNLEETGGDVEDDFLTWESDLLLGENNHLEISLISEFEKADPDYVSKAEV